MYKSIIISIVILAVSAVSCNSEKPADTKSNNEVKKEVAKSETVIEKTTDIKPEYLTAEQFREKVWDYEVNPEQWVYNGELPCVVDFYADWCKPCKMVAPIMDDLADYYDGKVLVYKVNTDEQRELATVFQVKSIPAILFAPKEGKPAMQPGALSKEDYIRIIDDFILKVNTNENDKKQS
ncbi:MAG: thiol reductase thioredoxin [Bacteroidales bacterium]|nr:thiol reductase thioredoxin [Bacteroidales bacterium]